MLTIGGQGVAATSAEAEERLLELERGWTYLTSIPHKHDLYSRETYVRESWADFAAFDDLTGRIELLQSVAMMVLKPEAFAGRRVERCLDFLEARGLVPIFFAPTRFSRQLARAVWHYQWEAATLDRLAVTDLLLARGEAALVLLLDTSESPHFPASVRLTSFKGAPEPDERTPDELRAILLSPNRMITFVHIPDEPMDVLREIAIFLASAERRDLYSFLAARTFENVRGELEQYGRSLDVPPVDFDPEAARGRLLGRLTGTAAAEAIRHVRDAGTGGPLQWPAFAGALRAAGVDPAEWDALVFAADFIDHDRPVRKAIGESGLKGWLDGTATFAPRRTRPTLPSSS